MKLERQAAQITMVLINYCNKFGFILSVIGEKKSHDGTRLKSFKQGLRKFQLCFKKVLLSDIESRMKGA